MEENIDLPKGWKIVKVSEIGKVETGSTPSKNISAYYSNDFPFYKPTDLEAGFNVIQASDNLSKLGMEKSRMLPINSILVTCIGATIGKTGIIRKTGASNQQINAIIPSKEFNPNFIYYQTISSDFQRLIKKNAASTTLPILNKTKFQNLEMRVCSLSEQNLIVEKINELLSELEKGKEQLETAQQQLKVYRQAVLKWAFEGKLTNKEIKEGELPDRWKWTKLADVCTNVEYGSSIKSKEIGKVPVLRMGNIQNGVFDWSDLVYTSDEEEIQKYMLKKDDVLFNRTNSAELVGKTAIYKGERQAIFAGYLIRINRIKTVIDGYYLTYFLNSRFARAYGNSVRSFGVNQSNINGTKLKTYPIPLPTLEEQQQIVQEIESRLSVCDKLEETIKQNLQQSEVLKQSILKKAFEGNLVLDEIQEDYKPKNVSFYQLQLIAFLIHYSEKKGIHHGEMTAAKYAYLLQMIFGIKTYYNFKRWHLGPYPPEMKKTVLNKKFFSFKNNHIEIVNQEDLFKYKNPIQDKVEKAINDLSEVFSEYQGKERSHKTELLATVCKVVEDIQSLDLKAVRQSMEEWKIELSNTSFKNKAEKFSEEETREWLELIVVKGWDKRLIE